MRQYVAAADGGGHVAAAVEQNFVMMMNYDERHANSSAMSLIHLGRTSYFYQHI